ncbi:MAG TPA: glutamine--fructose-6-phosphate aminotransferase, partial [Spirochaetota bacterium]|nr:glutamine--fructose-6-phosphate aminotransferase [Spirochaetota bacterium]
MCGIVGYIGKGCSIPVLIDGLKRLEYRGYDSAGLAVLENGKVVIEKTKGKVLELEKLVSKKNYTSS